MKKKAWKERVTISYLRKHGWTYDLINQYLGEPDEIRPNPHSKKSPPMKLYLLDRVRKASCDYNITDIIKANKTKGEEFS